MIKIPVMEENDVNMFRNKKVVIWGYSVDAVTLYHIFLHLKIDVLGIYDNRGIAYRLAAKANDIPIISLKNMRCISRHHKIIIQPSGNQLSLDEAHFNQINVDISTFPTAMILNSYNPDFIFSALKNSINDILMKKQQQRTAEIDRRRILLKVQNKKNPNNVLIVCNPSKTADHTLNLTFDRVNGNSAFLKFVSRTTNILSCNPVGAIGSGLINKVIYNLYGKRMDKIDYVNVFHIPTVIDKALYSSSTKVKIITAVREPISQNLSDFYQVVGAGGEIPLRRWLCNVLPQYATDEIEHALSEYKSHFIDNRDDAQKLFNTAIDSAIYIDKNNYDYGIIQKFIPIFNKHVIDLFAHPFDQEAGYTIIKEGNIEVFVYQLEKLNDIVPQLSEWVGVPFDKLEKGNVGEDKWIGESYKQAQKGILITQEYFDRCFNEPYVKHFYSEADIEKFKTRWRMHIK